MANDQEAKVKLTNTQLNVSAENTKTGTILRINKKNFQDEELPNETTKIRNAFADR